jgi:hypothetical protein
MPSAKLYHRAIQCVQRLVDCGACLCSPKPKDPRRTDPDRASDQRAVPVRVMATQAATSSRPKRPEHDPVDVGPANQRPSELSEVSSCHPQSSVCTVTPTRGANAAAETAMGAGEELTPIAESVETDADTNTNTNTNTNTKAAVDASLADSTPPGDVYSETTLPTARGSACFIHSSTGPSAEACMTTPQTTGYYIRPHVFCDVRPAMPIAMDELVGPVLCVTRFGCCGGGDAPKTKTRKCFQLIGYYVLTCLKYCDMIFQTVTVTEIHR